jgi:thioredoxin 2
MGVVLRRPNDASVSVSQKLGNTERIMSNTVVVRCPGCGANNRVPQEKIDNGLQPICGRCKTPLQLSTKPITLTDASFSAELERSPLPILVDLWAPWCGPCRTIAPVVDELAAEMAGRLRVAKLNVDENPVTAERFQVRGIPALLLLKAGREIDRIVGVQPKAEILRRVERAILS